MELRNAGGLTSDEVDHFVERGYLILRGAIESDICSKWFDKGMSRIERIANIPENGVIELAHTETVFMDEVTPATYRAAAQLLGGADRMVRPEMRDDFNYNTNRVPESEWLPPELLTRGWHLDGDYFKRFLDSPEQGLLCLILWSGAGKKGGGTFLACDSIAKAARLMLIHPEGLMPSDFDQLYRQCSDFVEVTGEAGDVVLCHPFMLHAPSARTTSSIRLITNPLISLTEPMKFDRADSQFSPVERAVLRGLGVESIAYQRRGEREHFDAWRRSREVSDMGRAN